MKAKTKRINLNFILYIVLLGPISTILYMYFSHDVRQLEVDYPHVIKGDEGKVSYEIKKHRPHDWVSLNQVSKYVKWAIIFSEDWSFYQHEGVDLNQMKVALEEMLEHHRFRGASTITQQMVKNIFLSEDRTLWRKIHEIILAHKVEKVLSKNRILEVYLNCIEYGPGIYGIRAASFHFFKKHPSTLTAKESAFIAMLLPSPKRYYLSFKRKKMTTFAHNRVREILKKLRMGKVITPTQYLSEIEVPLSWERN